MANTMKINGMTVEIHDEKNVLELIRKIGIEMPLICRHQKAEQFHPLFRHEIDDLMVLEEMFMKEYSL